MKFRDLLANTDWNEVRSSLTANYPEEKTALEQYQSVFDSLFRLAPRKTKMRICVEEVFREEIDKEPHVEVFGKDGTLNKYLPDFHHFEDAAGTEFANSETSFALEMVPWEEWLDMELDAATLEAYSGSDIVAHCLWEMTFSGFDQETIKEQRDEIECRARDLARMTEEERRQKLIPWEQVRKKLDGLIDESEDRSES